MLWDMTTCPKLVRLGVMARRLHVPVKWLRAEADAGRIPHLKAGRALVFEPETVERIIAERAQREGVARG